MEVIVPADSRQAEQALEYALAQSGPVYIRLNRNPMPELPESADFAQRKVIMLRKGTCVTIAANGITTSMAMKAAETLAVEGIDAEVLTVPFVKPLIALEWLLRTQDRKVADHRGAYRRWGIRQRLHRGFGTGTAVLPLRRSRNRRSFYRDRRLRCVVGRLWTLGRGDCPTGARALRLMD